MSRFIIYVVVLLGMSACSLSPQSSEKNKQVTSEGTSQGYSTSYERFETALVEPLPASQAAQAEIAQLTQLLQEGELDTAKQLLAHYRRGIVYDALGLPILALLDMNEAIEIDPSFVEAWHYMGIYYAQHTNYNSAYEAFDNVIELDPEHDYVYLNRGIAFYYDERYELALSDFADYYFQDPQDAFRTLWYYFAAYELDPGRAQEQLQEQSKSLPEQTWATVLTKIFTDEYSEAEVLSLVVQGLESHEELIERLCEAYFYLGKRASMAGNTPAAIKYFKLALMSNVYAYLEHRAARIELYNLRQQQQELY